MADLTVSNDIDNFMQSANNAAARNSLGLSNVDNTSDANKPVSTAQQAALDLKALATLGNVAPGSVAFDLLDPSLQAMLGTGLTFDSALGQGDWDPVDNSPVLPSAGTSGRWYRVSRTGTATSTTADGDYVINDLVLDNGSSWVLFRFPQRDLFKFTQNVAAVGHSMSAGVSADADVKSRIETLTGTQFIPFAIGGETAEEIADRIKGVKVSSHSHGDAITGETDIVITEHQPPRMDDSDASANWQVWRESNMLDITSVDLYDGNRYIGTGLREEYLAKADHSADVNQLRVWGPVVNREVELWQDGSVENLTLDDPATSLTSMSSVVNLTATVTNETAYNGEQSLKFVFDASDPVVKYTRMLSGRGSVPLFADRWYLVEFYAFMPGNSSGASVSIRQARGEEVYYLDGTGPVTAVSTWTKLKAYVYLPSGVEGIQFAFSGNVANAVYIDELSCKLTHQPTSHVIPVDLPVWGKEISSGAGNTPSAFHNYRAYYPVNTGSGTVELSETSGGAPIDLGGDGVIRIMEHWRVPYTPPSASWVAHDFKAVAQSPSYQAIPVFWSAINSLSAVEPVEKIIGDLQQGINAWGGDKFIICTMIDPNKRAYGSRYDKAQVINDWIRRTYPDNVVDTLQAAIDWGLSQPVGSASHNEALEGTIPAALRADAVHPTAEGYDIIYGIPLEALLQTPKIQEGL